MFRLAALRYLSGSPDPEALSRHPEPRASGPVGVLLVNLGTASAPTPAAIRRYLKQFLSDPRVIELPPVLWQIILRGFVLPWRPRHLAGKYKAIWMEQGSPLMVYSQAQAHAVQQALRKQGADVQVELAMRYGEPSIEKGMQRLQQQGCERILTVPMYPQYAASTTATAVDAVAAYAARLRNQPELRFVKRYHDQSEYIEALARQVEAHWDKQGKPQRLLLSFHGLPRVTVEQGDPYHRDCMETANLLARRLGEAGKLVHVSFQSRFGAQKWLEPYTLPTLQAWAKEGCTEVDVMCPGFLADCLETLEEIQLQCRDAFMAAGGRRFGFISCLNDSPQWATGFAQIIGRHLDGWTPAA